MIPAAAAASDAAPDADADAALEWWHLRGVVLHLHFHPHPVAGVDYSPHYENVGEHYLHSHCPGAATNRRALKAGLAAEAEASIER